MESPAEKSGTPRRWSRLAILLLVGALVFGGLGAWAYAPTFIEDQIEAQLLEQTRLRAEIGRVGVHLFRADVALHDVQLFEARASGLETDASEAEEPVLAFSEFGLNVGLLESLVSGIKVEEVRLHAPRVRLAIDEAGEVEWARLLTPPPGAETPSEDEDAETPAVTIESIWIDEGTLILRDASRAATPFEAQIESLAFRLEHFSTEAGETRAPYSMTARVGSGGALDWQGNLLLDPLRSTGRISLSGFALDVVGIYLAETLALEIEEGAVDFSTGYDFSFEDGLALDIDGGEVTLSDLSLRGAGESSSFLRLGRLNVRALAGRFGAEGLDTLSMDAIELAGGRLLMKRLADGTVDVARFFGADAATPEEGETAKGVPQAEGQLGAPDPGPAATPPKIRLGSFRTDDFEFAFEDRSTESPVALAFAPVKLSLRDVDLASGEPFELAFEAAMPGEGRLRAKGPVQLEPLEIGLEVGVDQFDLATVQPYWWSAADVEARSGQLSTALQIAVSEADGAPSIGAKGRVQLDDLEFVTRKTGEPLLRSQAIRLEGLDFDDAHLHLSEVALEAVTAAIEIDAKGTTNVSRLAAVPAESASNASANPASSDASAARAIRVDKVTLEESTIRVLDRSVSPPFKTTIDRLTGNVVGVANRAPSRLQVDLNARVDGRSPMTIKGAVDPIGADASGEVILEIVGFSMPPLSSYTDRYVGYGIDRGNVDIQLDYKLTNRVLEAENRFLLHRFAFGSRAESSKQLKFPLPLPVAANLIRDLQGNIKVDLPIRGKIDDPRFSVVNLLSKSFFNLLTRIATSPLSVLGSVLGAGGGDLSQVHFAPGVAALSEGERASLELLAKALVDRPQLKVGIRGRADPAVDAAVSEAGNSPEEGLRSLASRRARTVQAALLGGGEAIGLERLFIDDVVVDSVATEQGVPSEISLFGH